MGAVNRWHRWRYFVRDAWDEWSHSPGVNLLALLTLASTLFLAGLVGLGLANLDHQARLQRENVQVHVYLLDDIAPERLQALRDEAGSLDGVIRVEYVDKEQARTRYRAWAADAADLFEELESNPLPASLQLTLRPGPAAEERGNEVRVTMAAKAGVEEVRFDRAWLRNLEALLDLGRWGGTGLALLVFAAVVFVMASVLRLAVYARRYEIEIMLLVGATPAFVRGPFLVAGLWQGLLASGLSLGLVELARRAALGYSGAGRVALLELAIGRPLPLSFSLLLVGVGLVVSLAGAFFAVRRSF